DIKTSHPLNQFSKLEYLKTRGDSLKQRRNEPFSAPPVAVLRSIPRLIFGQRGVVSCVTFDCTVFSWFASSLSFEESPVPALLIYSGSGRCCSASYESLDEHLEGADQ
ncbi:unnamed protein product, partial [Ectocarpus sp. 12 AP-2014]